MIFPYLTVGHYFRRLVPTAITLCLACVMFVSCASSDTYPTFPPPLTKVVPVDSNAAFKAGHRVLEDDPRVDATTVDNAGRLIAHEKSFGFILFQHRTILDMRFEPVNPRETRITMKMSAEAYEMGGFTRAAGWYPSPVVDTFLGEDIMNLVEQKATATGQ